MYKLLVLGGSRYAMPVIKVCRELGIYVITADYLPNNYAHKYSDEYCNVSITDKEATLKVSLEKRIDGIISFACDPGVTTAAFVAEQMNLPSVGTYEAVSILQNKKLFRSFLREHNFNVPKAKGYHTAEEAINDSSFFRWPVIVKPTDSAGSKGVKRVDDPELLREAIVNALSHSFNKEFIIEEFIQQRGFSSDSDCFSVKGKLDFVSFNSQRFDLNAENPYVPSGFSWPSSMSFNNQKELASEIQRLISLLNLSTSVFNVETREGTDGKAYIMECSPRGGGNRLSECIEYATGVKLVENSVRAALGMPIIKMHQEPYNGYWGELILHSTKRGRFKSLWIADEIRDSVIEQDLWVKDGDIIGGFNGANESIGTLILKFDTNERLLQVMDDSSRYVKVMMHT